MAKIIDIHTHAFPDKIAEKAVIQLENFYHIEIPNHGDMESLLTSADVVGVEKIALHVAATKPSQVEVSNSWVGGVISGRIIGFGSLHPDYSDFAAELDRMVDLGLKGIKFHAELQGFALDDPRMWPIYEAIGERLIVMFHVGDTKSTLSAPAKVAKVLDAFPKLRVIAAHLGGYESWPEAEEYLYGRDLYIDTSSALWCMSPEEAARIIYAHGVDKVLFGSDYPVSTPKDELARLNQLPLKEEEKRKILWDNAARLLGL